MSGSEIREFSCGRFDPGFRFAHPGYVLNRWLTGNRREREAEERERVHAIAAE